MYVCILNVENKFKQFIFNAKIFIGWEVISILNFKLKLNIFSKKIKFAIIKIF